MSEATPSVPDIAEELMHEFVGVFAASAVTTVVIRLSRNAGVTTLTGLADLARRELTELAAGAALGAGQAAMLLSREA